MPFCHHYHRILFIPLHPPAVDDAPVAPPAHRTLIPFAACPIRLRLIPPAVLSCQCHQHPLSLSTSPSVSLHPCSWASSVRHEKSIIASRRRLLGLSRARRVTVSGSAPTKGSVRRPSFAVSSLRRSPPSVVASANALPIPSSHRSARRSQPMQSPSPLSRANRDMAADRVRPLRITRRRHSPYVPYSSFRSVQDRLRQYVQSISRLGRD